MTSSRAQIAQDGLAFMLRTSLLALALFFFPVFTYAAPAASDKSCSGDDYVCPDWMPTQGQVQDAMADFTRKLHASGRMTSPIKVLGRIEVSTVSCASMGPDRDSNFICGAEVRLLGNGGQTHHVQSSYTMRLSESNRFSVYSQGEWVEL